MSAAAVARPTDVRTLSAETRRFIDGPHGMLIGGQWVPAADGGVFGTYDPSSGELLGHIPYGREVDVDLAVAAAEAAFTDPSWSRLGARARANLLWRIADRLEAAADLFSEIDAVDNGMPFLRARDNDLPFAVDAFRYYAGWCTKALGQSYDPSVGSSETMAYTRRGPIGVVGLIVPWNYPVAMAALKLAPALAAGCTCILKPAEQTPLSALRLGQLLQEAGMPKGVVNIVTGDAVAGAAIARHPHVRKVAFTGSTEVAREIIRASSTNLKKVSLELGGKAPMFVLSDADLAVAIPAAATAIFYNSGQNCVAASRIYAHASIYETVLNGIVSIAERIHLAPGLDAASQMGPLITAEHRDRVASYVASAVQDGASLVTGGSCPPGHGFFYRPTVIANATHAMTIMREEVFGPVVTVSPFENNDDIPALANDSEFGLASSIWTRDLSTAHRIAGRIDAGMVGVNTHAFGDSAMPMGGCKQSGWGREFGEAGLCLYLETKTISVQL